VDGDPAYDQERTAPGTVETRPPLMTSLQAWDTSPFPPNRERMPCPAGGTRHRLSGTLTD
jgi:hypothetical protein